MTSGSWGLVWASCTADISMFNGYKLSSCHSWIRPVFTSIIIIITCC